jgi:hypothetical protein
VNDDIYDNDNLPHTPIDEAISSWSLPSVISLAVHGTYPTSFHVPRLTSFKFRFVDPTDDAATVGSPFDFLRNSPLLEDLEISYSRDFLGAGGRPISLPNLRSYTQTLHDHYAAYPLGLFSMLFLPPPCPVVLRSVVPRSWPSSDVETKATSVLPPLKNPGYLARVRGRESVWRGCM